ncbi:unnamed protein product, partial [Rotaria sp. Silwood2]
MIISMKEPYPLNGHYDVTTMEHESSGVIVEVGDNVYSEYNRSEPIGFIGLTGNGGFAKFVVVEDYMVHKIPNTVSFEQGALVERATVAVHAVKTSGLQV